MTSLIDQLHRAQRADNEVLDRAQATARDALSALAVAEAAGKALPADAVEQLRVSLKTLGLEPADYAGLVRLLHSRQRAEQRIGDQAALWEEYERTGKVANETHERVTREKLQLDKEAADAMAARLDAEHRWNHSGGHRQELARCNAALRQHPGFGAALLALVGPEPVPKPPYDPVAAKARQDAEARARVADAVSAFRQRAVKVVEAYTANKPNEAGEELARGRLGQALHDAIAQSPFAEPQLHDAADAFHEAIGQHALKGKVLPTHRVTG